MGNPVKRAKRAKLKAKKHRVAKQRSASYQPFNTLPDDDIAEIAEYFGYNRELRPDESPFDMPEEGMVCMISKVTGVTVNSLRQETGIAFEEGDWFIEDRNYKLYGAFKSETEAFDFGRKTLGIMSYLSAPEFFMP